MVDYILHGVGLVADVALALAAWHLAHRPVLHLSEPLPPTPKHPVVLTRVPCVFTDGESFSTKKVRLTGAGRPPDHFKNPRDGVLFKLQPHRNKQGFWVYQKVKTLR